MKNHGWLLAALSIMLFLINVDYTAMNLTMPTLVKSLNSDLSTIQWILSGYVLAWALMVVPAGKLTDQYGSKRLCLIGLCLFAFASLLSGVSNTALMIISGRVLQGIGGALFTPSIYAMVFQLYPEEKRGFAMGMISLGVGAGAAFGPSFGGILLTIFGWRSVFFINLPICLVCFSIIYLCSKSSSPNVEARQNFSLLKLVHIPLSLFKNKPYLGCVLGFSLDQFAFASIFVSSGIYLQHHLGLTAWSASLMYLPLTCIFGIIAVMSGSFVDKIGIKFPAVLGLSLMAIASYAFSHITIHQHIIYLQMVFSLWGIGLGLAFAALNTGVVKMVTQNEIGIASGVFALLALLGNSVGVILTVALYETFHYSISSIMVMSISAAVLGAVICLRLLPQQKMVEQPA